MTWFGANNFSGAGKGAKVRSGVQSKYLVATGAVVFTQYSTSAREALLQVKARLQSASEDVPRRDNQNRFSAALLASFTAGDLDFVVMDGERTRLC